MNYRFIREQSKLTMHEMGNLMGVHYTTISNWERGLQEPSPIHMTLYKRLEERIQETSNSTVKGALIGAGIMGFLVWLFNEGEKK